MAAFLSRRTLAFGAVGATLLVQSCSGLAASSASVKKPSSVFEELSHKLRAITHLNRVSALADWDQLVMMPDREEAHAARGDQLATLATVIH